MAEVHSPDPGSGAGIPSPHDRPEVWGPRLLRILEQQVGQFQELDGMSREQAALISAGRSDELLSLLGARQVVVDRITRLNGELEPFLASWKSLADDLPAHLRDDVRGRMQELDELVRTIAARDDADQRALEQRRVGVQDELAALSRNRNAVAAYASNGAVNRPHYQDRSG
ncbi:MAG: flagellar protein FlgN [Phycisphaerales bacterium]|nr:flagellar protein FlgN [Phycisphaerales bacterium]